jgi:lysophospholipase L1-like esterase
MKTLKYILVTSLLILFGCSLEEPSKKITELNLGDADFSRYVAIGNSLTAGYQSGALTESRQVNSYPNQIARQAGVEASFVQPLLGYPGIGTYSTAATNPGGILELVFLDNPATPNTVNPDPLIQPAFFADYPTFNPLNPYISDAIRTHPAPYNNLGIPGALTYELLNSTSAASSLSGSNSFFDVVLRNPGLGNTTVIQQASGLLPTFITCWIGNNDVLGYATSGGTFPPAPTDVTTFTALYGQLLDALQATGADIVVANIPDVTTIPFFTTIPPYIINPETNDLLLVGGAPLPLLGVNPAEDFVLLTATEAMKNGLGIPATLGGTDQPLPNQVVLTKAEQVIATQAVADFNSAIATLAGARNIPVVDINSFFNDVAANGYDIGGLELTTEFITGYIFSLDGVHPTSVGYSVVTNEFIKVINENFNATIPLVNIVAELGMTKKFSAEQAKRLQYNPEAFHNVVKMFSGR